MEQTTQDHPGQEGLVRAGGAHVRGLGAGAGPTRAELAAAGGRATSPLAQLESGRATPSVATLWALAAALGVPFARIVEEERPAMRVVRAREMPAMLSEETHGWEGRLL